MPEPRTETALSGLRLLLVDDEPLIRMMVEDLLHDCGCVVAGSYRSAADALAALQGIGHTLDGAVLDVNLGAGPVYPLADALAALGVPFVFATALRARDIDPRFRHVPMVPKPFQPEDLERILATHFAAHRSPRR